MPVLDQFEIVASTMAARTVFLSGDTSALLFSALAAIADKNQWSNPAAITTTEWDFIYTLIDKANDQLMTPLIGQIIMYVTADAPAFVLPCDGEIYNRVDYPNLYAVLDAAYIVDADTFRTPELQSRSPIGAGTGTGLSTYSVGENAGEEAHALTEEENATHAHTDAGHTHAYNTPNLSGLAVAPGELPVTIPDFFPDITGVGNADIQTSGSGTPHNTIHPVHAVKFGIIFQ